jgi:hypothetical protein
MPEWVRKNCKFAQYDQPMDPGDFEGPEGPEGGPGPKAHDLAGFDRIFNAWIQHEQLGSELKAFKLEVAPAAPLTIGQAFEFMNQGDMPSWAQDYCPDHQYGYDSNTGAYVCTNCRHQADEPADKHDLAADRAYDSHRDSL